MGEREWIQPSARIYCVNTHQVEINREFIMAILPVLDLMQGHIVRGIAGRRQEYRPIVSKLVDSADPLAVAQAFRRCFGFGAFYLADLDAIQSQQPALDVHARLRKAGFRLWIDGGIRKATDDVFLSLLHANSEDIVVGLESVAGPDELQHIVQQAGVERIVFSLDLKERHPLGNVQSWSSEPWRIAEKAISIGIQRLIVLDLARVGVGEGIGTESLCARLKQTYPDIQLTAGGGVRGMDDVRRLEALGVDYVLVASALHDGRITPDELSR